MTKKVSIIIPCYNGEKVINNSIESIYWQDYKNIELVVVDDGSTDQSNVIIKSWINRFHNKGFDLLYIYQNNRGLGGAIDTGLKHITGEYLTLLDADDVYLQGAISQKVKFLEQHPDVSVIRNNGWIVSGDNKWLFVYDKSEKDKENIFEDLLYGSTNNWAGSYMVRTEELFCFYKDKSIYPSRDGQNLQILLPLTYNKKVAFIDNPLMEYIRQDDSLSNSNNKDEQLKKGLKNAKGYQDIRIHILEQLIKNETELEKYKIIVNQGYWNVVFINALSNKNKTLSKEAIREMRKLNDFDINKRISYYNSFFPLLALPLRVLKKIVL